MAILGKGKGKRKKGLDVDAIVATHSTDDRPDERPAPTKAAKPGIMLSADGAGNAIDGVKDAVADMAKKQARADERNAKRNAELESKYDHVVPGSIRHVPKGEDIGGTISKGKVATIDCVESGCQATREVNCQDLFQTRRCRDCTATFLKERQKARRAERAAARKTVTTGESGASEKDNVA